MDVEPSKVADATESFGDTAVPWLAESAGFRSAGSFADPTDRRPYLDR
jgi:hypothetical protein